ncbi:MAG: response regulator [Bacteroidota bacterium]
MKYKSIIIDDSSVHRLAISLLIKNHPKLQLVGAYSNPYEGIEAIYKHNADLVFLDILLEDVNGFELLDAIEIPATVILNSSWEKFSSRAEEYGIHHFLVKPMRKHSFENVVHDVITSIKKKDGNLSYH